MKTTADLLKRALELHTAAEWERMLGLTENTMQVQKRHNRLSPVIAGGIALAMNENAERWIAIAAIENAKDSKAKANVAKKLHQAWHYSLLEILAQHWRDWTQPLTGIALTP